MLSSSIETYHLDQFKQALYHLEIFDVEEVEWKLDQDNVLRCQKVSQGYTRSLANSEPH